MKINVWVKTNKVGSISEDTIEIEDDDLKDMSEEEKEEYMDKMALEYIYESLMEWGCYKSED